MLGPGINLRFWTTFSHALLSETIILVVSAKMAFAKPPKMFGNTTLRAEKLTFKFALNKKCK